MVPEKIGKYKIDCLLAKGGMGAVYKAVHPELKRFVIIKKLSLRGGAFSERFKREAKILMDLNNNHIVHIYDYFIEGRSQYIVMEFVDGMSLAELRDKKKIFSPQMAVMIALDVALALKYAHDKGVVHRDVKPGNILISKRGEIKLADFGIASIDKSETEGGDDVADETVKVSAKEIAASGDLTGHGAALGTPAYMPPEQFADSSSVDMRADIYALGVVLFEMLAGAKPSPDVRLPAKIPVRISMLVKKMIRPNPKRRFQNFLPVIKRMRAYLNAFQVHDVRVAMVKNMVTSQSDEKPYVAKNFKFKRIALAVAASVVVLCLAAGLWRLGFFHRTLLRWRYTPVTVSIDIPAAMADSNDMRFRVFYFEDDGDKIPEIRSAARTLEPRKSRSVFTGAILRFFCGEESGPAPNENGTHTMVCRPAYLRHGAYRVKITGGTRVWWESFVVGRDDVRIKPAFGATGTKPLRVRANAYHAGTGERIASARFFVVDGSRRTPLASIAPERLATGSVVRIRCEAAGYEPALFSLKIEWFQDELFLNAGLSPAE